ncbi:MAG TPA: ABC transporter permease [Gammaproteobacteria bacterium]|nr:ABC transporter permease [Gammaproteobacteria bacterium]
METLLQDLRYAARMLLKNPAFTAATVLTLALGIGATTAIFSVVNTVLLRPLPYDDPGRIFRIRTIDAQGLPVGPVMQAHMDPLNEQQGAVRAAAYGFADDASIVGRDGLPYAVTEYFASARFFRIFTYPLALGRGFEPGDADGTTVLSHAVWRDLFRSDPDIVGSVVTVDGGPRTVIGVAAPSFDLPAGTALWTLFTPGGAASDVLQMDGYARLEPGTSAERLAAQLEVLSTRLTPWQDGRPVRFVSVPLLEDVVGSFSTTVLILSGAVAILLLIACLNVAMLLFTRAAARAREIAVRGALGAGPWRTVRQLLTETLALAVLGGALGVGLAAAAVKLSGAVGLAGLPRLQTLSMDGNVLAFAAACVVITAFAVGLAPALRQARGNLTRLISEGSRSASGGPGRNRLFGTLVVAEVALAVMLAIGAGLLVRNYVNLVADDPGFNPDRLLTLDLNVPGRVERGAATGYLPVARFYEELMSRIGALPGVESVAATSHVPLVPPVARAPFLVPGERFDPPSTPVRQTQVTQVSPEFFAAMGVQPVAGRLFEPSDRRDARGVALVNEAFARSVYGGGEAVGQRVILPGSALWRPGGLAFPIGEMATGEFDIVGVVRDIPQSTLWETREPAVYFPLEQWTVRRMTVVVRTRLEDPSNLIPAIRAVLADMDRSIPPVFNVYSEVLSAAVARQRLGTALLTVFGFVSLALTAVGIYGLMSFAVTQRSFEIAIRSALGARSGEMRRMIVVWALRLAATGIALGLAGAWAARTLVASQLYEISALDPLVFLTAPATMLTIAILSSYLPARRAAGIDPARTLRAE